ncbi:hypothetical protein [Azospirillum sp. TSO22-1]|uniref:hypothetical protein n=1 Tax=Azospirillum sp. TSO22-1 TaxID=716789 RepID=UPI000D60443D|nr:hypothetical protein [Azospirillum sp. TSO22-1]PWC52318.1 hypothetical protein TSO221_14735 [Azospirillum sp. TSO22-1]
MNQWLLWSRFAAINLFGVAGLVLAWINGWIAVIVEADASCICTMICALFLVGMAATLAATRVRLDREGDVLPESLNAVYAPPRSARR